MIPFLRSFPELIAIAKSRDSQNNTHGVSRIDSCPEDSGQHKRYVKSMGINEVDLPDLPKSIRHKWKRKKEKLSSFLKELDYNNQIQSSYDLTLQERLNNNIHEDAA